MMKKLFKIGAGVLTLAAVLGMASCGDGKNVAKLELKPEIDGLSEFMQFESDAVAINLDETSDGVKMYGTIQTKVTKAVASDWGFRFDAEVLDEDMNKICSLPSNFEIESKSDYDNDLHYYLPAGNYRMAYEIEADKKEWDQEAQEMWEKIKKKGKYLVLKPAYSGVKYKAYTGSSESSESYDGDDTIAAGDEVAEVAATSAGSEDWDKILDEYDSYCTKAVACAKKAMNGDMSAMSEYTSLLESAQSLQHKLENASGNLSPAQAARLSKIAAKMSSALM